PYDRLVRLGQAGKHQPVPRSQDLFVSEWLDTLFYLLKKLRFGLSNEIFDLFNLFPEKFRCLLGLEDRMKNGLPFEIAQLADVIDAGKDLARLLAQDLDNFV